MTYRCLDKNNVIREIKWVYLKNAWVSVITVCRYQLYPYQTTNLNNDIPDVKNLNLSLENLGIIVNWTNQSNLGTELQYNINNTYWETIIVENNNNETIIDVSPNDTIEIKVRHFKNSNYSNNYSEASMSIWQLADFQLYGLTENVNDNLSEANTLYAINYGDEFYTNKLKTFTNENVYETNHAIAFHNGLIYRMIRKNRDSYQGYEFEYINTETLEIINIPLTSNDFNCSVKTMCYYPPTGVFLLATDCSFYQIETNGTVTQLSGANNSIRGMYYYNNVLVGLFDNNYQGPIQIYVLDPTNGLLLNESPLFEMTIDGYNLLEGHSLTEHNGNLHAILYATNEQGYSGMILAKIESTSESNTYTSGFDDDNHGWVGTQWSRDASDIRTNFISGQTNILTQNFNVGENSVLSFSYNFSSNVYGDLFVKSNGTTLETVNCYGTGSGDVSVNLTTGEHLITLELQGVDTEGIFAITTISVTNVITQTNQYSFISQLSINYRALTSININEENQLIIQQSNNDLSALNYLSDEGIVGDLIVDTKVCCNIEEYQSVAFNPIDRHIYHLCMRAVDTSDYDETNLVFEKLNLDTLEVTPIDLSGSIKVNGTEFQTESYIDDGGDDMYDRGNFLGTNRSNNGFIEYTHTQQTEYDWEAFNQIADGVITDGHSYEDEYDYFGPGSRYFTNMYSGLFVMVAKDIDITSFSIYGQIGADGSGLAAEDVITLNNGHTGYFKKIYNSGDPSVNHLIIIPTKSGVMQEISYSTYQDFHKISNLSGVDYIYYLLFSSIDNGDNINNEITSEQARTIGNSFLNTITGPSMTIENILSNLNSSVTNITENIPNMFAFTDYFDGMASEFINYKPGLNQPHCMTYYKNNKFLVASNEGLHSITNDGVATSISDQFHWAECRGLAFVGDRLFATFSQIPELAEINPSTGEIINQLENKKGPTVFVDNNQIYNFAIRALASTGNALILMSYDNDHTYTLAYLDNLEPDGDSLLYATSIGQFRASGGLTLQKFGKNPIPGNYFIGYNEEHTGILVPSNYNEEEITLTADQIEVQWHEDYMANERYTDWNDIVVQEVVQLNEGGNFTVVIDKPVNNFKVRMRYKNPISKWTYYVWD
jgi:hypothetical protein